jgi:hypothetical protein
VRRRKDPADAGGSWLSRLERRLLTIFGPAQLGRGGVSRPRSASRTAGVEGRWRLRTDSTGRTYLVADEPGDDTSR